MEFWGHPGTSLAGAGRGNYITTTRKLSTFPQKNQELTDGKTGLYSRLICTLTRSLDGVCSIKRSSAEAFIIAGKQKHSSEKKYAGQQFCSKRILASAALRGMIGWLQTPVGKPLLLPCRGLRRRCSGSRWSLARLELYVHGLHLCYSGGTQTWNTQRHSWIPLCVPLLHSQHIPEADNLTQEGN